MNSKHEYKDIKFELEISDDSITATLEDGTVGNYTKNALGDWFFSNRNKVPRTSIGSLQIVSNYITVELKAKVEETKVDAVKVTEKPVAPEVKDASEDKKESKSEKKYSWQ